jgi:sporulation protein YlmC with PRC-barrel domain
MFAAEFTNHQTTKACFMKSVTRIGQDAEPRVSAGRRRFVSAVPLALLVGTLPARVRAGELVIVDPKPLAKAWRASRLISATVVNDTGQRIGSINDLLITPDNEVLFAVLSVGGFLGIHERLVAVQYSSLQIDDNGDKAVLPGASKEALMKLPEFRYAA